MFSPPIQAQAPFQKGFDAANDRESGRGMDQAGTDYVVCGTIDAPGDPADILLMNVDAAGTVSNPVRISQSGVSEAEWGNDVKAEPQGAYVIAGARRNGNNLTTAMLTQTTTTGGIQWSSEYVSGTLNRAFNAVAPVSNFAYCAAGYSDNQLTSGADLDGLVVIASNNTGSYFAGNTFGGVGDDAFHDVIELSNGNLLAVGYTESYGVDGKAMYLVVVDSAANKVWSRVVDGPGDDIAYAAVEDGFGITFVGQSNSYNMAGRTDPALGRFTLNGLFLSLNVYENTSFDDGARNVAYLPNDGYILSGTSMGTDSVAWLMRINANFGVNWYQHYLGVGLNDVEVVSTGTHFMGVGSIIPAGATRKDMYFVRTSAAGNTGSTCSINTLTPNSTVQTPTTSMPPDTVLSAGSGMSLNCTSTALTQTSYNACTFVGIPEGLTGQVRLHPNPGNGAFMVDYAFDGLREVHLGVYDLQGKMIYETSTAAVTSGRSHLDLQAVPAGTYLVRLRAGAEVWTRKLVKN